MLFVSSGNIRRFRSRQPDPGGRSFGRDVLVLCGSTFSIKSFRSIFLLVRLAVVPLRLVCSRALAPTSMRIDDKEQVERRNWASEMKSEANHWLRWDRSEILWTKCMDEDEKANVPIH